MPFGEDRGVLFCGVYTPRRINSQILLIFISDWSYSGENRSSEWWRPSSEICKYNTKWSEKCKPLILQLPTVIPRLLNSDRPFDSYRLWKGVVTAHTLVGVQHLGWNESFWFFRPGINWLDGQLQAGNTLSRNIPQSFSRGTRSYAFQISAEHV